jgi:hypothetical protein
LAVTVDCGRMTDYPYLTGKVRFADKLPSVRVFLSFGCNGGIVAIHVRGAEVEFIVHNEPNRDFVGLPVLRP